MTRLVWRVRARRIWQLLVKRLTTGARIRAMGHDFEWLLIDARDGAKAADETVYNPEPRQGGSKSPARVQVDFSVRAD